MSGGEEGGNDHRGTKGRVKINKVGRGTLRGKEDRSGARDEDGEAEGETNRVNRE